MSMTSRLAVVPRAGVPGIVLMLCALPASAHVKWFADWSIVAPPRDPMQVFSCSLWQTFFVAAVLAMALLAVVDWRLTHEGSKTLDLRDRLHAAVLPYALPGLRCGLCIYWLLVSLGVDQAVYLTPELAAPDWVRWVQMGCALAVLWRSTAWLAGLALIGMYLMAIVDHGWFHLLDYPVFLTLGVILMLPRWRGREDAELALTLLRWGAAVTLLWGGIEKFAYPEWSFAMLSKDAVLSLGVAPETAMYMYGFGEVAMAFGLLLFGIGSQVSAALLLAVFVAAVPAFGWIDLVGHSGIMVALFLLTVTRSQRPLLLRSPVGNAATHGALFPGLIALLCAGYFGLHALYLPGAVQGELAKAPGSARAVAQAPVQ